MNDRNLNSNATPMPIRYRTQVLRPPRYQSDALRAAKGAAEMIDPAAEAAYWRENYASRPYVISGTTFDDYGPAYRYGVESCGRYSGRTFEQVEPELMRDWYQAKGNSGLSWNNARPAVRDAWQHVSVSVEQAIAGNSDRD